MHTILFFVFSFCLISSSLGVILHRNPIKNTLFLVAFFVSLSAMFALLGSQVLATIQILVYVGAITVLFLFVVMFIEIRKTVLDALAEKTVSQWLIYCALTLAFAGQFIILIWVTIQDKIYPIWIDKEYTEKLSKGAKTISGNIETVSYNLFLKYLLPFEAISLLLLIAVVGALLLAKNNRRDYSD